jgi:tetratricopeptide (TPR) repeat protein
MHPCAFWRAAVLLLAVAALAPGFDGPTAIRVERAMDHCFSQRYDSAAATIAPLLGRPDDPAGYYWQSALVQLLLYDSGDPALADSFYRLCDSALAAGRRALARNPKNADAQFYCGMAQLNRANCQNWQQRRLAAAGSALDASGYLRAAARLGPGRADYEFGLGMLEYLQDWLRRRIAPQLRSQPAGLGRVRRAANSGRLCRLTAEFSLAWMMGEQGRYDSAVARCRTLLGRYPGNRLALRLMRDNQLAGHRYAAAVRTARQIDVSIRAAYPDNRYGLAENWLKLARAFEGMGSRDSAAAYASRIVAWDSCASRVPWLGSYVREARQIQASLGR